ncbi:hypothetical protein DPEC_G00097000, partial [Dallia pectoralis]
MSLTGGREDRDTASEISLSGEHDTTAKSPIQLDKPVCPVPSCVSMKIDKSMEHHILFREGDFSTDQRDHNKSPTSPVTSCVSMKSDRCKGHPILFRE